MDNQPHLCTTEAPSHVGYKRAHAAVSALTYKDGITRHIYTLVATVSAKTTLTTDEWNPKPGSVPDISPPRPPLKAGHEPIPELVDEAQRLSGKPIPTVTAEGMDKFDKLSTGIRRMLKLAAARKSGELVPEYDHTWPAYFEDRDAVIAILELLPPTAQELALVHLYCSSTGVGYPPPKMFNISPWIASRLLLASPAKLIEAVLKATGHWCGVEAATTKPATGETS